MIAMPFHPVNVYTIDEVNANLKDVLHDVEQKALVSLDKAVDYTLQDKIVDGKLYVEQGIIAGCAGGGFENIVRRRISSRDATSARMSSHSAYIRQAPDLYGTGEERSSCNP